MRHSKLPAQWNLIQLGEVCVPSTTVDPRKNPEGTFAYIDVSSVSNETFEVVDVKELLGTDAPSRARKQVQTGDVIFATVRPTLRRIAMIPTTFDGQVCSTGYCVVRANPEKLDHQFAYYFLLTNDVARRVEAMQTGATYPDISDSQLFSLQIGLPPLEEQKAITAVLRTVQEAIAARRREAALERERKAALMQRLFTYGTRGEKLKDTAVGRIPESWEVIRLGTMLEKAQYGISLRGEKEGQYPILRMNCLEEGHVVASDLQYVDLQNDEFDNFQLYPGDVLFNRTNSSELVGKVALFDLEGDFVFASYLIRLVTDTRFLIGLLTSCTKLNCN